MVYGYIMIYIKRLTIKSQDKIIKIQKNILNQKNIENCMTKRASKGARKKEFKN